MTWLDAIAEAQQLGRQSARFVLWCALLAAGIWVGWRAWGGIVG